MVTAASSAESPRTSSPKIAIRPPTAVVPDTSDAKLIAILDAPVALGESAHAGFQRKEHDLGALMGTLSALECRALHKRLDHPQRGDELANKFARLTIERRIRLLSFLADARRREALGFSQREGGR